MYIYIYIRYTCIYTRYIFIYTRYIYIQDILYNNTIYIIYIYMCMYILYTQ